MPTPKETARATMLAAWSEREKCVQACRDRDQKDRVMATQTLAQKDVTYRAAVATFKAIR